MVRADCLIISGSMLYTHFFWNTLYRYLLFTHFTNLYILTIFVCFYWLGMGQPHSCSEAALGLLQCLENLDCVKVEKKSMMECLKDPIASDDCRAVRNAYTMCKHSQLNMRTRIRGVRTY